MNRMIWILVGLLVLALEIPRCSAEERGVGTVFGNSEFDILSKEYYQAYKVKNNALAREKCVKLLAICPNYVGGLYNLACAEAMLGHKEEAFAALKKAIDLKFGWYDAEHLKGDVDLITLRDDKRWPGVVAKCEENNKFQMQFNKTIKDLHNARQAKNYAVVLSKCDEIEKLDSECELTYERCDAFAALGRKDEAFAQLTKIVKDQPKTGTFLCDHYLKSPALTGLMKDPRYQALLAQARTTEKDWALRTKR